ncbi:GIY-YIG nuclease family protein [Robiginitalea aurantiaca]|uniref:GIY-YIG nuclease family protein n=1 Tax=Robiginitalea aurantiaca TaxID=3056915 RepID=A0ABT7WBE4_9FLAO|nr:GIY-YIG nuclease family protein [Robiginitalea aurantiaca]MDM9630240.1 GIY-YIG nuclease family protein [Robiginitalea aurantiaca]
MRGLSKSQLQFLKKQGIEVSQTFDAKGLKKSEYRPRMKATGKIIAYNVSPCNKAGHTLRTRAGHCAQCNTAHIAFQKRNDKPGIVYIAGTREGKLVKVGYTKGVHIRSESLNRTKYGGFSDWEILYAISCVKAGEIEIKAKSSLKAFSASMVYDHDGKDQKTDEIYRCSFDYIKNNLRQVIGNGKYKVDVLVERKGNNYQFPTAQMKSRRIHKLSKG